VSLKTSSFSYLNYLHSVTPVKMALRMEVVVRNNISALAGKVLKFCVVLYLIQHLLRLCVCVFVECKIIYLPPEINDCISIYKSVIITDYLLKPDM